MKNAAASVEVESNNEYHIHLRRINAWLSGFTEQPG